MRENPGRLANWKVFKGEVCEMFVFWPNFWLLSFTLQVGCLLVFVNCMLLYDLIVVEKVFHVTSLLQKQNLGWTIDSLLERENLLSSFFKADFGVGFTHTVAPSMLACANLWWRGMCGKPLNLTNSSMTYMFLGMIHHDSEYPKKKGGQNMSKIRPSSFSTLLILTETTFLVQIHHQKNLKIPNQSSSRLKSSPAIFDLKGKHITPISPLILGKKRP